ncbi:hypothetical protein AMK16_32775 [Streptomyces sp. CB00455]|nr:hypothetical protein AMK16_32775 [Streptomyces sp. CB00455]
MVLVAADPGGQKPRDDAKGAPQPTVTATATATATVMVTLTPAPIPATASASSVAVPTPAPTVLSPSQDVAKTTGPRQAPPAPGGPQSGSGSGGRATPDDGNADGPSKAVSYRNCTDVRAADADPIRRGDPGYGRHLDRDGDGVACE